MQRPQKLDALTSLRFFAAAMIVVSHAHPIFGSLGIATAAPLGQGVSFFFVLSGFILAYNYPVLANGSETRHFWLARFARVWPLHAVTGLLWVAVVFNFDRQTYFSGYDGLARLLTNIFLLQAWIPLKDWALSFNGVSWSLSVEFFFYALFPFLIARWKNHWHWLLLTQMAVIGAILLVANRLSLPAEDNYSGVGLLGIVYFNPIVRLLEFSVGILVAFVVRSLAAGVIAFRSSQWFALEFTVLSAVVVSMLAAADFSGISRTLGEAAAYYFTREGLWLFFALLIGVFALSRGPITRLLSTRMPVFLGEISFSLYLCHALVIHYLEPYVEQIQPYRLIGYVAFWIALLMLSTALFLGVEQPARRLILNWPETKSWRELWRQSRPTLATATALVFLVTTMLGASFFRPSTISGISEGAVNTFLSAPHAKRVDGEATFDGRYTVIGWQPIVVSNDQVAIDILLRAKTDLVANDILALHLNDAANNILDKPGDVMLDKAEKLIPAGTFWIQRFTVTARKFEQSKSIGIAMYRNSSSLFEVKGGRSDWGGKRLVLEK